MSAELAESKYAQDQSSAKATELETALAAALADAEAQQAALQAQHADVSPLLLMDVYQLCNVAGQWPCFPACLRIYPVLAVFCTPSS